MSRQFCFQKRERGLIGGCKPHKAPAIRLRLDSAGIRKAGLSCTCLLLCLILSGCDVLYRLLDKRGAQEKSLIGEIVPFESNPVVEEVQILLNLYGYNPGKADGVLGLKTRNAVEQFQRDNGLEPSRFIDVATWDKLNLFKANKLVTGHQLNGQLIQGLLKKAGFNPGSIDGKMGTNTKEAIVRFQKSRGLKEDGKIGYKTLTALAELVSESAKNSQ